MRLHFSPQQITKQYEHNTPSLLQRVRCVADAGKKDSRCGCVLIR